MKAARRQEEMVRVAAIFAPGSSVRPVWFEWRKRKHEVKELSYFWKDRDGHATRLHFAVSDGCNLFELIYNASDQNWTLGEVSESNDAQISQILVDLR